MRFTSAKRHKVPAVIAVAITILGLLEAGCHRQSRPGGGEQKPPNIEILVSAAASLQEAFREIARIYESQSGTRVSFNFGASGALQKQIEAASPVDVFASAGLAQMDELARRDLIIPDSRRDFAGNSLVLITPPTNPAQIRDFGQLPDARVRHIAIGNPRTVPAGQYAQETLNHLKLWDVLESRLVLAEDVRQVLDYVARAETEAGVVYASDVRGQDSKVQIVARAPEDSHARILYPIAVVRSTTHAKEAEAFVAFVASGDGQRTLQKYGFERASK